MELEWTRGNKYIGYILNPVKGLIKRFIFKKRLEKRLSHMAPSFSEMVQIVEFLYFIDLVFLFENDTNTNGISGTMKLRTNQYIISLKVNETQTIKIILNDPKEITIEILNNGKLRSKIIFKDGEAEVKDKFDELLFININNCLMNNFTKVLFKYI